MKMDMYVSFLSVHYTINQVQLVITSYADSLTLLLTWESCLLFIIAKVTERAYGANFHMMLNL